MFQFRAFPSYDYFIHRTIHRYCLCGFPHSEISGSTLICSSPKLIAACHVLHRLLMPRHSPCALISLTYLVLELTSSHLELCRLNRIVYKIVFTLIKSSTIKFFKCYLSITPSVALLSYLSSVQFSRCRPHKCVDGGE